MDKELLRRYLNDDSFKAVAVVVGNKKIVLENDIHVDYENEIIIYPLKNCTRIIPFSSISYLDLLDEMSNSLTILKKFNFIKPSLNNRLFIYLNYCLEGLILIFLTNFKR